MLDRLNPLLEPGGELLLTECGTTSDKESEEISSSSSHRVVRPHPNFRLFLTADPSCGEVSRAMRNRCVEISLLEPPSSVSVSQPSSADPFPLIAATEHTADVLSLLHGAGLTDPAEAAAAVTVHSSLVGSTGKKSAGGGQGPAPRSLGLWGDVAVAVKARRFGDDSWASACGLGGSLRETCELAYPRRFPGSGSASKFAIGDAVLGACVGGRVHGGVDVESDVLDMLVAPTWKDVLENGCHSQVVRDAKVLRLAYAVGAGLARAEESLMLSVVGAVGGNEPTASGCILSADLEFVPEDEVFMLSYFKANGNGETAVDLVAHAAALNARGSSVRDRHLRAAAAWLPLNGCDTVREMTAVLFKCGAWDEVCAMITEMSTLVNVGGGDSMSGSWRHIDDGSLAESAVAALSKWAPADPRVCPDLFRSLSRVCCLLPSWGPFTLLLDLVDVSVGRRLALLLSERVEIDEARTRIAAGRGVEAGLSWLGLSCMICEGGYDVSKFGGRGRACSPETRLARVSIAPYVLPLFQAVDGLVEALVCRDASERAWSLGSEAANSFLLAVQTLVDARDSVSSLLTACSNGRSENNAPSGGGGNRLVFEWDCFLVAWAWLREEIDQVVVALPYPQLDNVGKISQGVATVRAVTLRIDAAVLEHAGGAPPARDTLWKHGGRVAAPATAHGALAIGKLRRLSEEFRVLPSRGGHGGHGAGGSDSESKIFLGSLMHNAHPSLCVGRQTRQELLDALCTLDWVSTSQRDSRCVEPSRTPVALTSSKPRDVPVGGGTDHGRSLSGLEERLPSVLDDVVKLARSRFESGYRGTRLGPADRDDGLEHGMAEVGDRFDDFETEAAEAITNATLLVVSGSGDGVDAASGPSLGGSVLKDWATLQLSPLREHWLAVEECQILARLAVLVSSGSDIGWIEEGPVEPLCANPAQISWRTELLSVMPLIFRLRSVILSTRSLSPAVARPYQTMLWAWEKSGASAALCAVIARSLPNALESWGRRLWENLVGAPGALSWQLAPPAMVTTGSSESGRGVEAGVVSAHEGPAQLFTLARSSFLLRLASSAIFHGGVVPGGRVDDSVDLTLMNASARLGQFRAAVCDLRELRYDCQHGALKPLVELSWARLGSTLRCFDKLVVEGIDGASSFGDALPTACEIVSDGGDGVCEIIEVALKQALECCPDERLVSRAEDLVLPAAKALGGALVAFGPNGEGPTKRTEAMAGLGMALLGSLQLQLILPSSPVDPGLRPALKKELLGKRLEGLKGELTVRRWSLRLDGCGDVSPQVTNFNTEYMAALF